MAGHSKWANIQHRKGSQDAKRGKLFTKLIREITVAARMGGGDAESNPRLRIAIDKALDANMTKDTVERAIKRGSGDLDGENYEEVRYEGYGPSGAAVIVDCMTDNRKRTVSDVRHAFTKCGGNLGTDGSVAYLFKHIAVLTFNRPVDEDKIMEVALEVGAEDITSDELTVEVLVLPDRFQHVKDAMSKVNMVPEHAEVAMRPSTSAPLQGDEARSMLKLLDMLEDLDDVQRVYSNADFPEDILSETI